MQCSAALLQYFRYLCPAHVSKNVLRETINVLQCGAEQLAADWRGNGQFNWK